MRVKVRTLALAALLVVAGGAWAAWRPAPPVPAPPPAPVTSAAQSESMRHAETAALALALLARPHCVHCDTAFDPFGLRVARIARQYLVHMPPRFRDDCSGFVSAVFTRAGVPMNDVVATLWDQAEANDALRSDHPKVGDLVFFDDTWDRDHDGAWDDDLTHVGLVVDIQPDHTVVFAQGGTGAGRTLGYLNLDEPLVDKGPDGSPKNSWLREPHPWDPPNMGYLASELFAAFATVDPHQPWH